MDWSVFVCVLSLCVGGLGRFEMGDGVYEESEDGLTVECELALGSENDK